MAKGDIKIVNGFKYSRVMFEGYEYRAIITLMVNNDYHKFEFFTTNTKKNPTFMDILGFIKKGTNIKMVNWTSKKDDDRQTELINETLSYFDSMEQIKLGLEMDNKPTDDFYTHGSY